jgi:hypothetical protein
MKSQKVASILAAVVFVGGLLSACASSSDGYVEEGSQDGTLEQNAIKSVMKGLGAIPADEKPIEAPPRAPLVVPPNRELRRPAAPGELTSANFPRNPEDVAAEERRRIGEGPGADGRVMTQEELRKYRLTGAAAVASEDPEKRARPLSPEQLKGGGKAMNEAIKRVENPSGRGTLIDPPDEYRKPSPNAPVAAPEEKSSWKPSWWPI